MRNPATIAWLIGGFALVALPCCQTTRNDAGVAARLCHDLCGLDAGPDRRVRPETAREAQAIAATAVRAARDIAREFRVAGPAWFHNCLVNTRVRERGLCWHYMEEMYLRLAPLEPRSFDLRCGVRDAGSLFYEHHCVIVTARGRPFGSGLILDPWTHGGRLLVIPVAREPWRWAEDPDFRAYLHDRYRRQRSGGGA